MSRYIDLTQNLVLYGDTLLPDEAFFTNDTLENKLVSLAFEVSRGVGELKLTEEQLALYSAVVLLSPGLYIRYGRKRFVPRLHKYTLYGIKLGSMVSPNKIPRSSYIPLF